MRSTVYMLMACAFFSLAGCTPPKETFPLAPLARDGVELIEARGQKLAVSHQDESDVSIFGLVHEQLIVVWVRLENYAKTPVAVSPDQFRAAAVNESGRSKPLKIFTEGKADSFKNLSSSLAGVYQLLKSREPGASGARLEELKAEWEELGADYQSLQQVLFSPRKLQVNETAEGYIVAQYLPAAAYTLIVPVGRNTHRFELTPLRPPAP